MGSVALFLAVLLLPGCGEDVLPDPPRLAIEEVDTLVSEHVPTVVTVRWTTDRPSSGSVRFGEVGGPTRTVHSTRTEDTEHEVLLLGLPPETEVEVEIGAEASGTFTEEDLTLTTGALPDDHVPFDQTGDPESWEGYLVLGLVDPAPAVAIIDPWGRVVWWHEGEADLAIFRARLSVDGTSVVYAAEGLQPENEEQSHLVRVPLAGGQVEVLDWPHVKHDFVEHEDGTLGVLTNVLLDPGDEISPRGAGLVERAPDGSERTVWSVHDDPEVCGPDPDLSHASALDYYPETDTYVISLLVRSCLVAISRETGEVQWVLSADGGDFQLTEDSSPFSSQHQFDLTADGVLIYDNGGPERGASRVVEYTLDGEAAEAVEVRSIPHDPTFFSPTRGDVERLEDGVTRVVWDGLGEVQHLDVDGDVIWQVETRLGAGLAYGTALQDFYEP